jgi:hypothetical protein
MRMRSGDTVVHMIPAAGYYAAYQDDDGLTYNPVVAWVVIEDRHGQQRVDGIDPSGKEWDGSSCGDQKGFIEFVYRDERERRR